MVLDFDPWHLILAARYEEALTYCDVLRPHWTARDWREVAMRGTVLMCLRRYDEAIPEFEFANSAHAEESKGTSVPFTNVLGAAHWLMGRSEAAAAEWLSQIRGLISGKIRFADSSGGVGDGMLLWFAAKSLGREDLLNIAAKFFKKAQRSCRIKSWPGPMASYALGTQDFVDIVRARFQHEELRLLLAVAEEDQLYSRELCQALFYWSFEERLRGNANASFELLKSSAGLVTPVEAEWFLARGMLEKSN